MANTNKIINFDLDRRNVLNLMTKQYDTTGARSVTFRLLKDSQIYNLNNKTVVIGGTKADGTTIFNECTKVDANAGIVRFDITTQMQTVAGTLELELIVIQDNVRLSTIPFDVVIIPSVTDLGKIQSTDEFGALQNALSKSDSIVQNFNTKMKELDNLKTALQESENNSEKQETQRKEQEQTRERAEALRVSQEQARVDAESSRVREETNRVNAEKERLTNESTRQTHEEQRIYAEDAREKAEALRKQIFLENEDNRSSEETQRSVAESTRNANEETRKEQEKDREKAETLRQTAEAERIKAENTRIQNETHREQHYNDFNDAEKTRVSNESSRQNAEELRVHNEEQRNVSEQARINAEKTRLANETTRSTKEDARNTAEQTRNSSEATRVQAETARTNAEQTRISNETSRVNAEEDRVSKENARVSAESTRVSQESARVQAESQRTTDFNKAQTDRQNTFTTNEQARVETFNTNEAIREANEKAREDFINNTAKPVVAKLNDFDIKLSNDIQKVYKTINDGSFIPFTGTDITVDNSKEGYTKDTILKGNTINVDGTLKSCAEDEGEIIITSKSKNLLDLSKIEQGKRINIYNGKCETSSNKDDCTFNYFIDVKEAKKINLYRPLYYKDLNASYVTYVCYNENKEYLGYVLAGDNLRHTTDTLKDKTQYIKINLSCKDGDLNNLVPTEISIAKDSDKFYESGINPVTNNNIEIVDFCEVEYKIALPIEGGLKSLPNGVCDTIEQRDDGVYLVQRVSKRILNGSESWAHNGATPNQNNTLCFNSNVIPSGNVLISDKFSFLNVSNFNTSDYECITSGTSDSYGLMIRISKNVLNQQDVNGFKKWLQANPTTVYYEPNTPIETKLGIDTINLETFKEVTYIYSNNNIEPIFNFKAPVDTAKTIADLKIANTKLLADNKQLEAVNKLQNTKIEDLNNTTNLLLVSSLS